MELYNSQNMPLSSDAEKRRIQEKMLRGEKLTPGESVKIHVSDRVIRKIGDYECKSDHCYRCVPEDVLAMYKESGFVKDERRVDYINGQNNSGIDWYLGGACPTKYGNIIIECPAYKDYFQIAGDNGLGMANDVNVRHMKSSPQQNPIPISMITNVFDYKEIMKQQKETFDRLRQEEMINRQAIRKEQIAAATNINSEQLSNGGMTR